MPSPARKRPQPGGNRKQKGFKVGPRVAKGSYQGHTDKIKRTLIHKATVKKQYYKDLKAEGYGDGTGGTSGMATGTNGGALGARKGKKKVKPVLGEQRRGPEEEEDDDDDDGEMKQDDDQDAGEEDDTDSDSDEDSRRAPSAKGKGKTRSGGPPSRSQPPPRPPTTAISTSASSSIPPSHASRPRLSEGEIEALREGKKNERQQWGKRGTKGQPKLGNRVEMLLGRIRKGMGE